jgi:hypothetical protein
MKENEKNVGPLKAVYAQIRINDRIEKSARSPYSARPLHPTSPPQPTPPTRCAEKKYSHMEYHLYNRGHMKCEAKVIPISTGMTGKPLKIIFIQRRTNFPKI